MANKEKNTPNGFEKRMPREIFGAERKEAGENCIMSSFIMCTAHQILFYSHQIKEDGEGM
jgi:hypothetical protein